MAKNIFLTCIISLFIIIGIFPMLAMLFKSITVNGHITMHAYSSLLKSPYEWKLMKHSLILSLVVTICTIIIGVPLGIVLGKTDIPVSKLFIFLFIIPMLIPPYIIAISWFDLLGKQGILSKVTPLFIKTTNQLLFGLPGCGFVLFSIFLPIPMLMTILLLHSINPRLEEAGKLLANWRKVLKYITLPIIIPGISMAAVLVFLFSLGEFTVPNFLRYNVFPVESFIQFSAFYNFRQAIIHTIPLLIITLILLIIEKLHLHKKRNKFSPYIKYGEIYIIRLNIFYKITFFIILTIMVFIIVILPLLALIIKSSELRIFLTAFEMAKSSILRSIMYAIIGATFLSILGFFLGYIIQTKLFSFASIIDSFTIFLLALPSTVIGIGLINMWNTSWTKFIYSTPLIIIMGYIAKYTAITSKIIHAQLSHIPRSMEEAAQMLGAKWSHRILYILGPLAKKGIVISWIVGYIFLLRDTGITMLVYPPGHDTLSVRIFTLMANGSPELIASLCIIMICVSILPMFILIKIFKIWS